MVKRKDQDYRTFGETNQPNKTRKAEVKKARSGLIPQSDWDALESELQALHNLQSAAQVALRDVPHQKDCARQIHDAAECTCIRAEIATLEAKLAEQLDS